MRIFVSIALWVVGSLLGLLAFISCLLIAIVLSPFDKQRKAVHAQCFWLADAIIGLSPFWRLDISGLENIDKTKTYVIISNHQSVADIIVMYKTRMQFKWVAKESVYRVPFVGTFLLLGRHIRLSRDRFGGTRRFYREARQFLKSGMSILFFPEGTRSQTGYLGKFQNGAFKMAIREKVPILPIFIDGTRNVVQKGSLIVNANATCRLFVLPPIATADLGQGDLAHLKAMVHSRFEDITV